MADNIKQKVFRNSRNKIVLTIMSLLTAVLVGTLLTIYGTTYLAVYRNNQTMLKRFMEENQDGVVQDKDLQGSDHKEKAAASPDDQKQVSDKALLAGNKFNKNVVFYLVKFSENGSLLKIMNDIQPVMSNDALEKTAWKLATGSSDNGVSQNLVYRVITVTESINEEPVVYVVMMDNMLMHDSMTALVQNAIIFGFAALIIFFLVSIYIAKRIVQPMEEAYQKQKQFISDASHELKTPISTMDANAELLKREVGENRWLENIIFENHRMKDMVTLLLDLARTENVEPILEEVDFSHLVIGGVLPFDSVAYDKGISLNTNITPNIHVIGDSRQLGQLVSTLIDNALTHTSSNGGREQIADEQNAVCVSLVKESGAAVFRVMNPGKPIPEAEREKIFDRFYRSDSSRELNGHYGLGLAIAKAITTVHKGKIFCFSEKGNNIFTVRIPLR